MVRAGIRDGGRGADGEAAEPQCGKNKNQPLIGSRRGCRRCADGGTRISASGAGIGPAELPADARWANVAGVIGSAIAAEG